MKSTTFGRREELPTSHQPRTTRREQAPGSVPLVLGSLALLGSAAISGSWWRRSGAHAPNTNIGALKIPTNSSYEALVRCTDAPNTVPCSAAIELPSLLYSNLAICAMFKDETSVPDWLDYHRIVGVDTFHLFGHQERRSLSSWVPYDSLAPMDVSYQPFDNWTTRSPQIDAYNECLRRYKNNHKFIAFIDLDEYLVTTEGTSNVSSLLDQFSNEGGLAAYWEVIGSSNHMDPPEGPTVENYVNCVPDGFKVGIHFNSLQYKTIANTKYVTESSTSPHMFSYRDNKTLVGDRHQDIGPSIFSEESSKGLVVLYHYILKSKAEFMQKVTRGGGDGHRRPPDLFDDINNAANRTCDRARDILRHAHRAKNQSQAGA